jgi:hypothetical protein
MPKAPESRTVDVDVQDLDTRGRTLHGYASVYTVESGDLGGFHDGGGADGAALRPRALARVVLTR